MKFQDYLQEQASLSNSEMEYRAEKSMKTANEHINLAGTSNDSEERKMHHAVASAHYKVASHYFGKAGRTEDAKHADNFHHMYK